MAINCPNAIVWDVRKKVRFCYTYNGHNRSVERLLKYRCQKAPTNCASTPPAVSMATSVIDAVRVEMKDW